MQARFSESTCVLETGKASVGMLPQSGNRSTFYLLPGHIFVSTGPCTITTILGSCVSVCLWDALLEMGGANHFQLPCCPDGVRHSPKFGASAVPRLLDELLALGCRKSNLQAMFFGGACVMEPLRNAGDHLGMRNARIAFDLLQAEGIAIVGQDVGGHHGRKVIFDTHDGSCLVKPL